MCHLRSFLDCTFIPGYLLQLRNMQIPVVTSQTLPDTFVEGARVWRHLVVLHGALSNTTALLHSLAKYRNIVARLWLQH